MGEVENKVAETIAAALQAEGIPLSKQHSGSYTILYVRVPIPYSRDVAMSFYCGDEDEIRVCVPGLIRNVDQTGRSLVLEECNRMNRETDYVKYYLDPNGWVNVEYTISSPLAGKHLGSQAVFAYRLIKRAAEKGYAALMLAFYTDKGRPQGLTPCDDENDRRDSWGYEADWDPDSGSNE